jgi:hypothetical protein
VLELKEIYGSAILRLSSSTHGASLAITASLPKPICPAWQTRFRHTPATLICSRRRMAPKYRIRDYSEDAGIATFGGFAGPKLNWAELATRKPTTFFPPLVQQPTNSLLPLHFNNLYGIPSCMGISSTPRSSHSPDALVNLAEWILRKLCSSTPMCWRPHVATFSPVRPCISSGVSC